MKLKRKLTYSQVRYFELYKSLTFAHTTLVHTVQPFASDYTSSAKRNVKVSLLRHEDEVPVFVPKEAVVETPHVEIQVEDNSDLLK